MEMDPTRIPTVLDALREAWEGQPDLSLPQLMTALEGIDWTSMDDDVLSALEAMSYRYPAALPTDGTFVMETVSPCQRITIGGDRVTIRSSDPRIVPVTWSGAYVVRARVSAPLVVADADGIRHHFGVITLISRLEPVTLVGRSPRTPGVVGIELSDGSFVELTHLLRHHRYQRRRTETSTYKWKTVRRGEPGEPLVVTLARGGEVALGEVREYFPLE